VSKSYEKIFGDQEPADLPIRWGLGGEALFDRLGEEDAADDALSPGKTYPGGVNFEAEGGDGLQDRATALGGATGQNEPLVEPETLAETIHRMLPALVKVALQGDDSLQVHCATPDGEIIQNEASGGSEVLRETVYPTSLMPVKIDSEG